MFDNSGYDEMFSSTETDQHTTDDFNVRRWKLGNHRMRPTVDADELRRDAERNQDIDDGLASVLEHAAKQVENASVNDFQCPVCGLSHGHSDDKHDIRTSLNVTETFAERMKYNPACHCGVNELAVLIDFYGSIVSQMFTDDDDFAPFEEMMPSDEADTALALLSHPDLHVDRTRPRRKHRLTDPELRDLADGTFEPDPDTEYRATFGQVLSAARLQDSDEMRASLRALDNRFDAIRTAANSAPIPKDTERDLNELRDRLERRF